MYKNLYISGIFLLSIGVAARPAVADGREHLNRFAVEVPPMPSRNYNPGIPSHQAVPSSQLAAGERNTILDAPDIPSISSENAGTAGALNFPTASVIDDQVTISGSENITNPKVYIDGGFQSGDFLAFPGSLPGGVTVAYNTASGALSFTGTATPAQWQAVFRQITFRTVSANTADRTIKYVLGDMVSLMINGKAHYYEYVRPSGNPSWATALSSAASRSLYGMQGYLATITSQQENDFIKTKLLSDGWVGGSDDYQQVKAATGTNYTNQSQTEGKWYWITGPEKGTPISTGNNSPVAVNGAYMNWASGEPNNSGDEHSIQLYSSQNGKWNDLSGAATSSVPGYVVEYGGYSNDPVINIYYSRVVKNIPAAPAISNITDDLGLSSSDKITSDQTLLINGTAPANSSVKLTRVGTGVVGTVSAGSGGLWSYDYTGTTLAEGTHQFTATATVGGVESSVSNTLTVVVDVTAPDAPSAPALQGSSANATTATQPSFQGTAEPNSFVRVYTGSTQIATAYANGSGEWVASSTTTLSEGSHNITATATDVAGNTSIASQVFALLADRTAPATPDTPIMVNGDGRYTNEPFPTFNGTTEANATINIYNGGVWIAALTADNEGKWVYTAASALSDGDHTITVRAADALGNTSSVSSPLTITVDTQAPDTPADPALTGGHDGYINNNTPVLTGSAEAYATVTIYHDGQAIGTTVADDSGNWSYTFDPALADGDYTLEVTATDAAGNTSNHSGSTPIHVDTQNPNAPDPISLTDGRNGYINTNRPVISGNAEPGVAVTIYYEGMAIATVTADEQGNWTYTFTQDLEDGSHQVITEATDRSGNTSEPSSAFSFIVDTTAPDKPGSPQTQDTNVNGQTNNNKPTIHGTAEPGATITIYDNGVPVGTVVADENGNWQYVFDPGLGDGGHSIQTTATDTAGNTSPNSEPLVFKLDTGAPGASVTSAGKTAKGPFSVTFSFDEPVENFSSEKILLVNATGSNLTRVNETEYTLLVTPLSDKDVKVQLAASAAFDLAGNGSVTSNMLVVTAQFSAEISEVYPNPASSVLNIRFAGVVSEKCRVRMVKATGQIVLDQQASFVNNLVTLNVSHLSSGVYTIIIISNNRMYQKQVMIGR